ncbi:MAG: hypothetical protein AB8G18_17555 [Gammaproteobacteria bacterium]
MSTNPTSEYLSARGIESPGALDAALHLVLEAMEPIVHEGPTNGLTLAEQAVLIAGGLDLHSIPDRDPVAEGAVKFAAIVENSLPAQGVAETLELTATRVRQLISSRELYSFQLDGKRLVPMFQIINEKCVPNIGLVNQAMPEHIHPLSVFNWYHLPNADLCIDNDLDVMLSPIDWLSLGNDPDSVVKLAERL